MRNIFASHQEDSNFDNQHLIRVASVEALKQSKLCSYLWYFDPKDEFYRATHMHSK